MNGLTAVHQQTDDDFDAKSEASGLDTSDRPDLCRQEDAKFTDINFQLKMFGADPFAPRQPMFGTVDYNLDLTSALTATADAKFAFKRLPESLRAKYPSWIALLDAAEKGELAEIDLRTGLPLKKPDTTTTVPPTPTGANPA